MAIKDDDYWRKQGENGFTPGGNDSPNWQTYNDGKAQRDLDRRIADDLKRYEDNTKSS